MTKALDSTEPQIPRFSMWRAKPGQAFSGDVERLYGKTVLVRAVNDGVGVRFHKRGGTDLEEGLSVNDFLMWFEMCHKEGERCRRCHRDPIRYPDTLGQRVAK